MEINIFWTNLLRILKGGSEKAYPNKNYYF